MFIILNFFNSIWAFSQTTKGYPHFIIDKKPAANDPAPFIMILICAASLPLVFWILGKIENRHKKRKRKHKSKKRRKLFAVIFLISTFTHNISIAKTEEDPSHWKKERVFEELASPWTTSARTYLYVGTGTVVTLLLCKEQLIDETQSSVSSSKPLGQWSTLGDYGGQLIPNALYFGVAYSLGETDNAMMMFKSTLYASVVTTTLKYSVNQKRPNGSNSQSFPSGHATTAFAFASTVAAAHEWYWGAAAYAFAGFVGFSRMNDNMHYVHDVAAGATIGMVYGVGVSEINKRFIAKASKTTKNLSILPLVDTDLHGLSARYEF